MQKNTLSFEKFTDWIIHYGIKGTITQHHTFPFFLNPHLLDQNSMLHLCTLHLLCFLASPHNHVHTLHSKTLLVADGGKRVCRSGCEWDVFRWWWGGGAHGGKRGMLKQRYFDILMMPKEHASQVLFKTSIQETQEIWSR